MPVTVARVTVVWNNPTEPVLVPPTTTLIPGRRIRTGAERILLFTLRLLMTRPCIVTTVTVSPLGDSAHMDAYAHVFPI